MSAAVLSSAKTTRLGGGAPRSGRQSAEQLSPASIQRMIGSGLAQVSGLAMEGEIDIGFLQRSGQSAHARLSTIPPVGEITGAQARPIAEGLNCFFLDLVPNTN